MTTYIVRTQDVDGRAPPRHYKTFAGARKRFEEMVGYRMETAIDDRYYESLIKPRADTIRYLSAVSNYGTVVTYERKD